MGLTLRSPSFRPHAGALSGGEARLLVPGCTQRRSPGLTGWRRTSAEASMANNGTGMAVSKYETEEGLKKVAAFLRGRKGMPLRQAIEMEKRVEFFKGDKLVKFLLDTERKGRPDIKTEEEAIRVCKAMLHHEYFHRSEKHPEIKGHLEVSRDNKFVKEGYYTWIYEGGKVFSHLLTAMIIIGFLLVTCFPIWPRFLKVWMWYVSVTLLVFMLGFLTIRGLVFFFMWILGYEFWILPRLFDETLAFAESFVPVWSFEKGSPGQGYYRIVAVGGVIFFFYWAYTQPTDFDTFIMAQKDFMADLYEGNLLSDVSQEAKENIDKPKVQSLEDILRELDEEEDEGEMDMDKLMEQFIDDEVSEEEEEEEEGEAGEAGGEGGAASGEL